MANQGEGVRVIWGLKDTRKALREFAPDLQKEMNQRIRTEGNKLRDFARSRVPNDPPVTNWNRSAPANGRARGGAGWPAWNAAEIRKGIKFKSGGRTRVKGSVYSDAYSLRTESAAGVIYEVGGRRSNGRTRSGAFLIKTLNNYGVASRGIWAALDAWGRQEMQKTLQDIVDDTNRQLQARLDAANDREVI